MTRLRRAYLAYNKRYFSNKLPKDVPVLWVSDFRDVAEYELDTAIRINTKFKTWRSIWKMALLHEMCHVKHPQDGHGLLWKAEMLRLAVEGAFDNLW